LGDIGQPIWVTHGDGFNIRFAFDQQHFAMGQLPIVPIVSGWPAWPIMII
jgi:YD repeat-containing protein